MNARILLKSAATACVLTLTAVAASDGQLANGRWQQQPTSAGSRRAVQAPRADTVASALTPGVRPIALRLIPAMVMSDGSIYADFGNGLEPVRRACSNVVVSTRQIPVIAGNGQVLFQTGPGTQPSPAQLTQSQLNLPSASQRPASRAALSSCFMRDASGRVFVPR